MAKNIGIITGGNVVIDGDMNVNGSQDAPDGTNVGIITTGDGDVVVNGTFNVGGKNDTPKSDAEQR